MSETNEPEEELKSPLSKATANALAKQEKMLHAINDALDAIFNMGCELGVAEQKSKDIDILNEAIANSEKMAGVVLPKVLKELIEKIEKDELKDE
jgi:hypothetical protein